MADDNREEAPRPYSARGLTGYGHCPLRPESAPDSAYRAIERQELATRCRWRDANGDEWHQRNRLYQTEAVMGESLEAWGMAIAAGLVIQ